MSETTELKLLERAWKIMDFHDGRCPLHPLSNFSGTEEHLAEYKKVRNEIKAYVESHPTPPASEPSEQPVADAETFLWSAMESVAVRTHNGLNQLPYAFVPAIAKVMIDYARRASARAVEKAEQIASVEISEAYKGGQEAERQRLARLVDERILIKTKRLGYSGQLSETHIALRTEIGMLEQFRSWLAGEGEKP